MNHFATTKQIIAYYDDFLKYLKIDHTREGTRHKKIKSDLTAIVKKDMDILDLGCGTGITSKYMADLGAKVTAMDISPKLIEYAKENSYHKNINYVIGDIAGTITPNSSKTFDLICLIDIMEHLPKDKIPHVLTNIIKHSHKDTIIYLNIPDARFQEWIQMNHPEKQQIIDQSYSMISILTWFNSINFEVANIVIYGIETPIQYVSYYFIKKESVHSNYRNSLE